MIFSVTYYLELDIKYHSSSSSSFGYIIQLSNKDFKCTKHCFECHMVFYVILAILKYHHPNLPLVHALLVYHAPQHLCNKMLSWMIEIWMKKYSRSDDNGRFVDLLCPNRFTRNDKLILGLHVVLVTLHGRFPTTMFCLISVGWNLVWPTLILQYLPWLTLVILQYLPCLEFSSKYEYKITHTNFHT